MKVSEVANLLTEISTPFGGASWQPAARQDIVEDHGHDVRFIEFPAVRTV
jgi:hypothetical protein